jgi:hypothetical protein
MKEEIIKENGNNRHANSDPRASEQVFADMDEAIRVILWKVRQKWGGGDITRQEDVKDDVQETVAPSPCPVQQRPAVVSAVAAVAAQAASLLDGSQQQFPCGYETI